MHNLDSIQTCPQPVVAPEFQLVTQSDGVMLVQVEMLVDLSSIFGMQFCTQNSAIFKPSRCVILEEICWIFVVLHRQYVQVTALGTASV